MKIKFRLFSAVLLLFMLLFFSSCAVKMVPTSLKGKIAADVRETSSNGLALEFSVQGDKFTFANDEYTLAYGDGKWFVLDERGNYGYWLANEKSGGWAAGIPADRGERLTELAHSISLHNATIRHAVFVILAAVVCFPLGLFILVLPRFAWLILYGLRHPEKIQLRSTYIWERVYGLILIGIGVLLILI